MRCVAFEDWMVLVDVLRKLCGLLWCEETIRLPEDTAETDVGLTVESGRRTTDISDVGEIRAATGAASEATTVGDRLGDSLGETLADGICSGGVLTVGEVDGDLESDDLDEGCMLCRKRGWFINDM